MAVERAIVERRPVRGRPGDGKRFDRRRPWRIAFQEAGRRQGSGKRGGYRTLPSARTGRRYVFLHGFPKREKGNITQDEEKTLQFAGKVFLELSVKALNQALKSVVLLEVHCGQDH